MDETFGAQYALQIALQTLRERCQQFQQRILTLEEENLNLRSKSEVNRVPPDGSLPEIDALKQQITQLTEQKTQLTSNVSIVTAENRRLWARLSKLTQANENLGSKLNKINDTLTQHNSNVSQNLHTTLIRSKTFTQDEPHIKFVPRNVADESDKISLELEDISLKLISSIAKEKSELELQCSQMAEIQNSDAVFINSLAFACPSGDIEDSGLEDFDEQLTSLKNIKLALSQEKEKLQKNINNLKTLKDENKSKTDKEDNRTASVSVQTTEIVSSDVNNESLTNGLSPENSTGFVNNKTSSSSNKLGSSNDGEKICPMCSKMFYSNCKFSDFQNHVESHFIADSDGISNFEVVP